MNRLLISRDFVEDALDCVRSRGLDPRPVLAEARIRPGGNDPVTTEQYGRMWLAITACLQDEFFGLGSRAMRPGSFRLLCYVVLHAGTLERALRRALQALNVLLDGPAGVSRRRDGTEEIVLSSYEGPHAAFACRTYWIILLGLLSWLIGRRLVPRCVECSCRAPEAREDYRDFFGTPVRFERPRNLLVLDNAHLKAPLIRDEKALRVFLNGAPANILLGYRSQHGVSSVVRNLLRNAPAGEWQPFDAVAKHLELSPATLRRRLRAEGQSYLTIRNEVRYARAREWLQNDKYDIAEIAARLGYAEPGAFHRAFTKWSAKTPSMFRTQVRASMPPSVADPCAA